MAKPINLTPTKTYKTLANMERAVSRVPDYDRYTGAFRYLVCRTEDGRYYPVFVGRSSYELASSDFCAVG